jgi:hypothetical protein
MKTKVIFRKWKDGTITAFFPEIPSDLQGYNCQSYSHIGQHGGADYGYCRTITKPANIIDAASLARELKGIGYDLRIARRETAGDRLNRKKMDYWNGK